MARREAALNAESEERYREQVAAFDRATALRGVLTPKQFRDLAAELHPDRLEALYPGRDKDAEVMADYQRRRRKCEGLLRTLLDNRLVLTVDDAHVAAAARAAERTAAWREQFEKAYRRAAALSVSGALKPTSRTCCDHPLSAMVSPSMTWMSAEETG